MICLKCQSIPQSKSFPFPKDIFLLKKFKSLVNRSVQGLEIAKKFKPRMYTYADFILVKLYAITEKMSTEWASETLNAEFSFQIEQRYHRKLKTFTDGIRRRRMVPHQTDVDRFFKRMSQNRLSN